MVIVYALGPYFSIVRWEIDTYMCHILNSDNFHEQKMVEFEYVLLTYVRTIFMNKNMVEFENVLFTKWGLKMFYLLMFGQFS